MDNRTLQIKCREDTDQMKEVKTLSDLNLDNKRVLVRVDLNSDILKHTLIPSARLTASLKTIKELQKHNCRIVLIAHQGRPGSNDFTSLKQHAQYLQKHIKLSFVLDVIGKKAQEAILLTRPKEVVLLENLRFEKSELKYKPGKPNKLVDTLGSFFDIYINDAFSASHREHASIVGFPRKLPSVIGRVFEHELKAVQKLNVNTALLVLGGIKPDDYIELIKKTKGLILPTGFLGLLVLQAHGYTLGKENVVLKPFKHLLHFIKQHKERFITPLDVAVQSGKQRIDISVRQLPSTHYIYDVGKQTIDRYKQHIKQARTIFFKGLPGLCHTTQFTLGTETLLKATAYSNAFSVIGGGHTLTLIDKLNISKKKFGYVSLSGGALMYYLAHGTLPGIEALRH